MPSVFISYSRADSEFVRRLHDALNAAEYDVWVDWEDIRPSAAWNDEIRSGVGGADGFIYVISPDSVASEVCGRELNMAVERNKRIVPVVHREPGDKQVPEAAAALNWVFLRDDDDFDKGIETLKSAVETDLDHVRTHTVLGVAASRWDGRGRDRSLLLRGQELGNAEAWLVGGAGKEPQPTQLQREFVLASRQGATRRQRTLIGGVSAGLVIAIVLAIVALVQRSNAVHEANVALSRQFDADAQVKYDTDPEESIVLARKAAQITPDSDSTIDLRAALAKSPMRVRYTLDDSDEDAGDAVWSPDGARLLVTSPGTWTRIYRPGTNAPPVNVDGTTRYRNQSAWDALGNRVILGGHDTSVYDAQTGALIRRLGVVSSFVALTPNGSEAVTVDGSGTGDVFDVATGQVLATFHPSLTGGVTCFALSPNGTVVAQCDDQSGTNQNTAAALDTWNVGTGKLLRSIPSPTDIARVSFNPTGSEYVFANTGLAVVENADTTAAELAAEDARDANATSVFVYRTTGSGPPVKTFAGGAASAVAFGPDSSYPLLAYAFTGPQLYVYNFKEGKSTPLLGATDTIETLNFSRNGVYLVEGGADNTARVYNAVQGGPAVETLSGDSQTIWSASFGSDDHLIATTSDDGTTRLWASPLLQPSLQATGIGIPTAATGFSADGTKVFNVSAAGTGEVMAARSLRVIARIQAPGLGQGFGGAQMSLDGRYLFASTGAYSNFVTTPTAVDTFDARTGRLVAKDPPSPTGAIRAGLDRAGDELVTIGATGPASEWDPRTGKRLHTLAGPGAFPGAIAVSRDGSQIAILHYPTLPVTVTDTTTFGPVIVDLFSGKTGKLERTVTADDYGGPQIPGEPSTYAPLAAAFSPDGGTLAVAGGNDYIELLNARTGKWGDDLATTGVSLGNYVVTLAYSPNGEYLAAGAAAGAFAWQIPGYVPLIGFQQVPIGDTPELVGDGDGVAVAFTADSSKLITTMLRSALGSTVEAWTLTPGSEIQLAELQETIGTLNPAGTTFVGVDDQGVSLYPCPLCGNLSQLMKLAAQRITLGPASQTQLIDKLGG